jgi:large subunit ribosomal protein L24
MKTTKPEKQRKRLYQDPLHKRYKRFSAPLSPELKKAHGINSIPVRKGDTVRVMRGERKGFEGKVSKVDRTKYKTFIEGATRETVDGTAIPIQIHPSKLMITRLNLDDKWRKSILERKSPGKKVEVPEEIAEEKEPEPPKEEVKKKRTTRKKAKKPEGEGGEETG